MTPAADFESWLSRATRKLAPDGVERIRAEIGEHYQSALASGRTPEQAIAALGKPKAANRAYRKVFLTKSEARMAHTFTKPNTLFGCLVALALMSALRYVLPSLFTWTIVALYLLHSALNFFYPPRNQEQSRKHLVVWSVVGSAVVLWFVRGELAGIIGAVSCTVYLNYKRWVIFRKLGGKPAPVPAPRLLPGEPGLTCCEAMSLRWMWPQELILRVILFPFIALMVLGSIFVPLLAGPFTALFALRFILPCVISFYTPARHRWYVKTKRTLLALGVILPPFQFLMPMPPGKHLPIALVLSVMVFPFLVFFVAEWPKISLRRKLPVEEWPKALYL
jgi:hypothetical protein